MHCSFTNQFVLGIINIFMVNIIFPSNEGDQLDIRILFQTLAKVSNTTKVIFFIQFLFNNILYGITQIVRTHELSLNNCRLLNCSYFLFFLNKDLLWNFMVFITDSIWICSVLWSFYMLHLCISLDFTATFVC